MSRAARLSREERRRAELDERRARRRERRRGQQRSMVLPLSLAAVALGVVAIVVFMVATAPTAGNGLQPPAGGGNYALADGQALGRDDAPLTMEIYSDFQCPACGTFAETVKPALVADYVATGELRLVYRDFAFLGAESIDAAVGARCAAEQNRFWQYHDYLFANQQGENRGAFSAARLRAIAEAVGLDMDAYSACVPDPAQRQAVLDARAAASSEGIASTPTLLIEGQPPIVGVPDYANLRQVLDGLLEQGASQ